MSTEVSAAVDVPLPAPDVVEDAQVDTKEEADSPPGEDRQATSPPDVEQQSAEIIDTSMSAEDADTSTSTGESRDADSVPVEDSDPSLSNGNGHDAGAASAENVDASVSPDEQKDATNKDEANASPPVDKTESDITKEKEADEKDVKAIQKQPSDVQKEPPKTSEGVLQNMDSNCNYYLDNAGKIYSVDQEGYWYVQNESGSFVEYDLAHGHGLLFPLNEKGVPMLPVNAHGLRAFPFDPHHVPVFPLDPVSHEPIFPVDGNGRAVFPIGPYGRSIVPVDSKGVAIFPRGKNGHVIFPTGMNGRPIAPLNVYGVAVLPMDDKGEPIIPRDAYGKPLIHLASDGKTPLTDEEYHYSLQWNEYYSNYSQYYTPPPSSQVVPVEPAVAKTEIFEDPTKQLKMLKKIRPEDIDLPPSAPPKPPPPPPELPTPVEEEVVPPVKNTLDVTVKAKAKKMLEMQLKFSRRKKSGVKMGDAPKEITTAEDINGRPDSRNSDSSITATVPEPAQEPQPKESTPVASSFSPKRPPSEEIALQNAPRKADTASAKAKVSLSPPAAVVSEVIKKENSVDSTSGEIEAVKAEKKFGDETESNMEVKKAPSERRPREDVKERDKPKEDAQKRKSSHTVDSSSRRRSDRRYSRSPAKRHRDSGSSRRRSRSPRRRSRSPRRRSRSPRRRSRSPHRRVRSPPRHRSHSSEESYARNERPPSHNERPPSRNERPPSPRKSGLKESDYVREKADVAALKTDRWEQSPVSERSPARTAEKRKERSSSKEILEQPAKKKRRNEVEELEDTEKLQKPVADKEASKRKRKKKEKRSKHSHHKHSKRNKMEYEEPEEKEEEPVVSARDFDLDDAEDKLRVVPSRDVKKEEEEVTEEAPSNEKKKSKKRKSKKEKKKKRKMEKKREDADLNDSLDISDRLKEPVVHSRWDETESDKMRDESGESGNERDIPPMESSADLDKEDGNNDSNEQDTSIAYEIVDGRYVYETAILPAIKYACNLEMQESFVQLKRDFETSSHPPSLTEDVEASTSSTNAAFGDGKRNLKTLSRSPSIDGGTNLRDSDLSTFKQIKTRSTVSKGSSDGVSGSRKSRDRDDQEDHLSTASGSRVTKHKLNITGAALEDIEEEEEIGESETVKGPIVLDEEEELIRLRYEALRSKTRRLMDDLRAERHRLKRERERAILAIRRAKGITKEGVVTNEMASSKSSESSDSEASVSGKDILKGALRRYPRLL